MTHYHITCVVHQEGLAIPLAEFPTWEEAELYIRQFQRADNLKQEFEEWFDYKIREYGFTPQDGRAIICCALPQI
jgi:hypothetical protein